MPRYFFNLHDDDGFTSDNEGEEFPDLQSAREDAQQSAREILAETVIGRQPIDNKRIEISDGRGNVLEIIRFRDLLY